MGSIDLEELSLDDSEGLTDADVFGAADDGAQAAQEGGVRVPEQDMPRWASFGISVALFLFLFRVQIRQYLAGLRGTSALGRGRSGAATGSSADISPEEMNRIRLQRLQQSSQATPSDGLRKRNPTTGGKLHESETPRASAEHERQAKARAAAAARDEKLRLRVAELNAQQEAKEHAAKSKADKAGRARAVKSEASSGEPHTQAKEQRPARKQPAGRTPPKAAPSTPLLFLSQKLQVALAPGADAQDTDKSEAQTVLCMAAADKLGKLSTAEKLAFVARAQREVDTVRRRCKSTAPSSFDTAVLELAKIVMPQCAVAPLAEILRQMASGDCDSSALKSNLLATDVTRLPLSLFNEALEQLSDTHGPALMWQAVEPVFVAIWTDIRGPATEPLVERLSAPDNCIPSLRAMASLLSVPAVGQALSDNAAGRCLWLPPRRNNLMYRREGVFGSDVEKIFLGPLFALGCIPDAVRRNAPDGSLEGTGMELNPEAPTAFAAGKLGEFFFPHCGARSRQAESEIAIEMARDQVHCVQDELFRLSKAMLRKGRDCRTHTLQWLSVAVECNANRAKIHAHHTPDSSDNTLLNLSYVLLKLCEPFLDAKATRGVEPSIQSDYAVRSRRYLQKPEDKCSFESETKFAVESRELDAWVDRRNLARIKQFQSAQKKREREEAEQMKLNRSNHEGEEGDDDGDDENEEDAMDALLNEEDNADQDGIDAMDALIEMEASDSLKPDLVQASAQFNFVTECFFLTARALHHGFVPTMSVSGKNHIHSASTYLKLLHALSPISRHLNMMGRAGLGHPLMAKADSMYKTKFCLEAAMLDPRFLNLCLKFYSVASQWLIKLACNDSSNVDFATLQLPLPLPVPMEFASLPEHFAEDIVEFIMICLDEIYPSANDTLFKADVQIDAVFSLSVVLLYSPGYVRNPYLRAKFVAMIKGLLPPESKTVGLVQTRQDFSHLFNRNTLAKRYLTPALLRIYVDVENTGAHNQSHDKIPIRENVYDILEHLCDAASKRSSGIELQHPPDPCYRDSLNACLLDMDGSNGELIKKFISLLLNDTTKNFEDGVMHMSEAKILQEEEDRGEWASLSETELKNKKDAIRQAEGIARHNLIQTHKTMHFLAYVTDGPAAEIFMASIFVDRMAVMLNSFVDKLAGAKMGDIKVRNPEELGFRPIELLELTTTVLVNLFKAQSGSQSLPQAIVAHGMFEERVYLKAMRVIKTRSAKTELGTDIEKLISAVNSAEECTDAEDLDLSDCPDDFLDPLMATLMSDPVDLPCGNTVDRVTIERSLLDAEINPFSREPLTADDLVPNVALKKRIERWIACQRSGQEFVDDQ